MGVSVMYGVSAVVMALTFVAALCAAIVQMIVGRWGTPTFFSQVAGGFTVTMVAIGATALARRGVEPFTGIRPSLIVVAGIMMMLAGVQVVGATSFVSAGMTGVALAAGASLGLYMNRPLVRPGKRGGEGEGEGEGVLRWLGPPPRLLRSVAAQFWASYIPRT